MSNISIIDRANPGRILGEQSYNSFSELAQEIIKEPWAPATFSGDKRRISEAISVDLLVLDIDSGCSLAEAKALFASYRHIIATTRNHQKEKNGLTCDRFRVILELERPSLNDSEFKTVFSYIRTLFPFVDESCKDISRFFFPSQEIISVQEQGQLIKIPSELTVAPVTPLTGNPSATVALTSSLGELSKTTLKFLLEGAEQGYRHQALVKACFDMKEQGYSETQALDKIQILADNVDPVFTNAQALATIKDIFNNRIAKYEPRPQAEAAPSIFVGASELLNETFDYLSNKDLVTGDPTGIEGLDKLLGGGFRLGELTVMMAQAKTGKNTLYHYLMHGMLKKGMKIGYASRELDPAREVIPNLLTIETGKNFWKEEMTEKLKDKAISSANQWQLYFAPGYGYFPVEKLREWVGTLAGMGVKHFWADHFHYMLGEEDYNSVSRLIKEIKTITKEFNVHMNLIVQPKNLMLGQQLSMDTLKGGSSINQALDNLLILERHKSEKFISKLKLEVARHKLAQPGQLYLRYDPHTTSFEEVDELIVDSAPEPTPQLPSQRFSLYRS